MVAYWIIWFFIIGMSFLSIIKREYSNNLLIFFFIVFMVFFIGWRYEVGGDWNSYQGMFNEISYTPFPKYLLITEPGYAIFNKVAYELNLNMIFVNFICAILFMVGFFKFIINFKYNKWVPILICFSYIFIAVGMGYTRQSVALGFVFLAFASALNNNNKFYVLNIIIGCLFHMSSLFMLLFAPLLIMNKIFSKNRYYIPYLIIIFFVLYFLISRIYTNSAYLVSDALTGEASSKGSVFRMLNHSFALCIFLLNRSNFKLLQPNMIKFFDSSCIFIIFLFYFSFSYSTIVDRFNLYLVIFDIMVLCYFLSIQQIKRRNKAVILIVIAYSIYYSIFFMFWILYSPFVKCCFQYKNIIMEWL